MDEKFVGYCGVNCSECMDLINYRCPGCRFSPWTDDDICPPVKCCREKSIDFCGECSEFPCEMMEEFYDESDSHRAAKKLMEEQFGK